MPKGRNADIPRVMTLLQLILISIIQGITEWLPISSSAHVLLAADYFALSGQDEVVVNAAAHFGTLFAVLAYFWRDVRRMIIGFVQLCLPQGWKVMSPDSFLALCVIVATPVALVAGVFVTQMPDAMRDVLRSIYTVAGATIVFGLALWWADVRGSKEKTEKDLTMTHAFWIGASQAIAALIPGTSRSGITMTLARAYGYERREAARFAMLIGIPILLAGGAYAMLELVTGDSGADAFGLNDGLIVVAFSFLSGWVSIWGLMALLNRMSFLPFVLYRLALGCGLILLSPLVLGLT